MAGIYRQIIWRQCLIAKEMQDIKGLPQFDKIFVICKISRPPAMDSAMYIWRTRDHAKMNMVAANGKGTLRISRGKGKF